MGRGHDWRQPRRRGFDDDDFSPPSRGGSAGRSPNFTAPRATAPSGPTVRATVKWFNGEKGFGFVEVPGGDAFLHISALERAGHSAVSPGTTLEVQLSPGQKGQQVAAVLKVDASTASAEPSRDRPRSDPGGPRQDQPLGDTVEMLGTVKWYNPDKGFGFVAVADGGKDVFLHASVLRRAALTVLTEGQAVRMRVGTGSKGREAVSISVE